jgi:hypothetical protein
MARKACHCPEVSNSEDTDQADSDGHTHPHAPLPVQPSDKSRFSSVNSDAMRAISAIFNEAGSADKHRKTKRKRDAGKRTLHALAKFFRSLFGHKKKHKGKARSDADIVTVEGDLRLHLLKPEQEGPQVYDSDAREISTVPSTLTELAGNVPRPAGRQNCRPGIKSYQWPGERLDRSALKASANIPDERRCLPIH